MHRVLSLYIAITSVLVLTFGGIPLFDISPISAFIVWGIAVLWFVGLILYLPQRVHIQDIRCTYPSGNTVGDYPTAKIEGRIFARHTEQLEGVYLVLENGEIGHQGTDSLPDRIENTSYKFTVFFPIKPDMTEHSPTRGKRTALLKAIIAGRPYISKPFMLDLS